MRRYRADIDQVYDALTSTPAPDVATLAAGGVAALGLAVLAWVLWSPNDDTSSDVLATDDDPTPSPVSESASLAETPIPDVTEADSTSLPAPAPTVTPLPPGNGLIRDEVRSTWANWSKAFEGRTPTLYLDVKGLATTGVGNLVDPISLALPLPWLKADNTPASQNEITAEWNRVKAMPKGQFWKNYQSPNDLHLADDAIDALVLKTLDADAAMLQRYYPDFATFPADAQRAILSIAWAVGAGFPSSWPNFTKAVLAKDWTTAAANSSISATGNPGIVPRNAADKAALLAAASENVA